MKIERFNENINGQINDRQNIKSVKQFVIDFGDSIDINIPDWISERESKLKEYYNVTQNRKKYLKFSEDKNLPNLKKYILIDDEIDKLRKQIEKLETKKDDVLYYSAANEILYKFQSELLENDFNSFYIIFLEDNIDYDNENPSHDFDIFSDVHPNILKNRKYKQIIDLSLVSRKYNI